MSANGKQGSLTSFLGGVWEILTKLEVPSGKAVVSDLARAAVVVSISSILFAVIDSIAAPIAKWLLNG